MKHGLLKPCFFYSIFSPAFSLNSVSYSVIIPVHIFLLSPDSISLLVVVNVVRPDLGGGVLFSDLFEGLAARGIRVTVKCAYSYYPEWRDNSGKNGWNIRHSTENGVRIERHGLFIPRNPNSLCQRLIYEASFYLSLRRHMPDKDDFDAILVFCPLVGAVAYATAVRRRLGVPLWLNVQDLSAQAAAASGIAGNKKAGGLLLRIQNYLFCKADLLSSISASMIETLQAHNLKQIPVRLMPNWLHLSLAGHIESTISGQPVRAVTQPLKLLYSGNIGSKQDLIGVCREFSKTDADFLFRIQGTGARAEEIEEWIRSSGDSRFELHALTDEKGLADALSACDYYVITERTNSGHSFIPSKLIPSLAAATPVLAICDADSPLGFEMEEFCLGPRIDWSDLSGIPALLSEGAGREELYRTWQENCRERSNYYDRESAITRSVDLIVEMITLHRGRERSHQR